jgi:pimeloyl-ACP methyl ester carboxylesterase
MSRRSGTVMALLPSKAETRGKDRTNPVLLVVHGAPGFPEMPFAHENAQLEEKFVVVHWDHRGAGKSFRLFGRKPALSIDVMVEDIRKVGEWLRQRLQIEKVFLVAHSWGTVPAILAASRYPDLFWAYIGVAQIADLMASERHRYQYAFTKAQEQGNLCRYKLSHAPETRCSCRQGRSVGCLATERSVQRP